MLTGFCYGQSKIEGVGQFKIGKTTLAIIDELKSNGVFVKEMKPDTNKLNSVPFASYCSQTRVFSLGTVTVSGVELQYPFLKFYNGILIDFYCDGTTSLSDALHTKYGNPAVKSEKKIINCSNALGVRTQQEETLFESTWSNGNILAVYVLNKRYDDQCKLDYVRSFHLYDIQASNQECSCNAVVLKRLQGKQTEQQKNNLKDFEE